MPKGQKPAPVPGKKRSAIVPRGSRASFTAKAKNGGTYEHTYGRTVARDAAGGARGGGYHVTSKKKK